MKRKLFLSGVTIVLLLLTPLPPSVADQDVEQSAADAKLFLPRPVGSWLGTASSGAESFRLLVSIAPGGTVTSVDSNDFDLGGGPDSTAVGSWRRTGFDTINVVLITFLYDTDGALQGVLKLTGSGTVAGDNLSGTLSPEFFFPEQDPLTEVGIPFPDFTIALARIVAP